MDPLTAFSVAGTVIQFVDFSTKLVLGARELYKSSSGVLSANQELELVTSDLQAVLQKLGSWTDNAPDEPSGKDHELKASFALVQAEATRLAGELMTKLDRLKVSKDLKGHQRI